MVLPGVLIALLLTATPLFRTIGTHPGIVTHEGGHALVGSLTGGKVQSIRVDRAGTGETKVRYTSGSGLLMMLAGYLTPPVVGLAALALAHGHHSAAALAVMLVALVFIVLLIRNLFGLFAVVAIGVVLYAVLHHGDPAGQTLLVSALGWTLLFGSVRLGLQGMSGGTADAHNLAKATHLHWILWQLLFTTAALAAAAFALWLALDQW